MARTCRWRTPTARTVSRSAAQQREGGPARRPAAAAPGRGRRRAARTATNWLIASRSWPGNLRSCDGTVRRPCPAWRHIGPVCGTAEAYLPGHGHPAPRPRRRDGHRPRSRHRLLHRGHGPASSSSATPTRSTSSAGTRWTTTRCGSSYAPRVGFELMTFKVEREDDLSDLENAVTRYGFPVQRVSQGRVGRPGRVDPLRDAVGPHHGAGPRRREGRRRCCPR